LPDVSLVELVSKVSSTSPGIWVEAGQDVIVRDAGGGRRLAVVGALTGVRVDGRLSDRETAIRHVIADGAAAWADRIEGRVLLVEIAADGSCVVTADRFGQRDLYMQEVAGGRVLATRLDLMPVALTGAAPDAMAYAHALTVYGFRPPKRHTFYRGVSRLGVGESVVVTPGAVEIRARSFHAAQTERYDDSHLEDYSDAFLEGLRARASENGNVVYLSSGWDSTAILAGLVHLFGPSKIRAVAGRMVYADRSGVINQFEIDRAQKMADFFGVPLRVVDFDYRRNAPDLIRRVQPELRAHMMGGITAINHWILAEAAADGPSGEVCFAGEMSDGAHNLGFSQYATYFHPVVGFREYFDKAAGYLYSPSFLRRLHAGDFVDDPLYQWLRGRVGAAAFDVPATSDAGRVQQLIASCLLRGVRVPLWSLSNNRLLTQGGRERFLEEVEGSYLGEAATHATPETLYSWYLHLYNSFHWQGSTVATIPVTAEYFGRETALPYHDGRLQDFLSAMPESWGRALDLHPTKYPLKWMLTHRIKYPLSLQEGPHSYLYDVDPTFNHSAEALYGSSMRDFFVDALQGRAYRGWCDAGVFDVAYIDTIVDRYLAGTEVRGAEMNDLWALCVLTMSGRYGDA
jgi:hypothetical protein